MAKENKTKITQADKDKTSNEERRELREILSGLPLELTRYL